MVKVVSVVPQILVRLRVKSSDWPGLTVMVVSALPVDHSMTSAPSGDTVRVALSPRHISWLPSMTSRAGPADTSTVISSSTMPQLLLAVTV